MRKPYYFEQVKSRRQIADFRYGYHWNAGRKTPISTEYTKQALTISCYRGSEMVGGFCMNVVEWQPLRHAMPFTPEQWEGLQVEKDISEKDILEIGGLWTEKGLSGFRKLVLYAQMIIIAHEQARLQNKKYIMCGTHVKALRPFMHRVMRKIVYDGYCKLGDRDEWVTLFAARTEGLFLWASVQILQRFVFGWLRKLLGRSSDSSHHKNLTKLTPTARFSVRKMPRRGRSERATRR